MAGRSTLVSLGWIGTLGFHSVVKLVRRSNSVMHRERRELTEPGLPLKLLVCKSTYGLKLGGNFAEWKWLSAI
jgi:hypothetical protein